VREDTLSFDGYFCYLLEMFFNIGLNNNEEIDKVLLGLIDLSFRCTVLKKSEINKSNSKIYNKS